MYSLANLRYRVLILLSIILLMVSCADSREGKDVNTGYTERVKVDSIHAVETRRLVSVLIAAYIKPQFFSLRAKPFDFSRTESSFRLKDSLQRINSAFGNAVFKKMESGEVRNTAFRWTEELIPKAIIVDFEMDKRQQLFNEKLPAMAGNGLYFISEPLFNSSYDLALIGYGFSCGDRCGEGRMIVYRKIEGRWVEYKLLIYWVV